MKRPKFDGYAWKLLEEDDTNEYNDAGSKVDSNGAIRSIS